MPSLDDIYCELLKSTASSDKALWHIAMALSVLPKDILEFSLTNCAFITLDKEDKGVCVSSKDERLNGREHLIFLPDWLWSEEGRVLAFVIARQIAYAHKQHKSGSNSNTKNKETRERDADHQAIEWLGPKFPKASFNDLLFKDLELASH